MATELVTSQAKRSEEEGATLERWLRKRADEICGVSMAGMADLFDTVPAGPAWQSSSIPLDRLAGYAADGNNPTTRRREANSVVELFQRRSNERGEHGDLSPPVLRPIGMLMLVPAAFAT